MNEIAIRVYLGRGDGFVPQPFVAIGEVTGDYHPQAPVFVDEECSWMITHGKSQTVFASFFWTQGNNEYKPWQVLISVFVPDGQRIAQKSALSLLDALKQRLLDLFPPDQSRALPLSGEVRESFLQLLSEYDLEPCPWYIFHMDEDKPRASFCVESRAQLEALTRYSGYGVFTTISCLELGMHCPTTINIPVKCKTAPAVAGKKSKRLKVLGKDKKKLVVEKKAQTKDTRGSNWRKVALGVGSVVVVLVALWFVILKDRLGFDKGAVDTGIESTVKATGFPYNTHFTGTIGSDGNMYIDDSGGGAYTYYTNGKGITRNIHVESLDKKTGRLIIKSYDKSGGYIGSFDGYTQNGYSYSGVFTNTKGGSVRFELFAESKNNAVSFGDESQKTISTVNEPRNDMDIRKGMLQEKLERKHWKDEMSRCRKEGLAHLNALDLEWIRDSENQKCLSHIEILAYEWILNYRNQELVKDDSYKIHKIDNILKERDFPNKGFGSWEEVFELYYKMTAIIK